jgi:hypothetical protein
MVVWSYGILEIWVGQGSRSILMEKCVVHWQGTLQFGRIHTAKLLFCRTLLLPCQATWIKIVGESTRFYTILWLCDSPLPWTAGDGRTWGMRCNIHKSKVYAWVNKRKNKKTVVVELTAIYLDKFYYYFLNLLCICSDALGSLYSMFLITVNNLIWMMFKIVHITQFILHSSIMSTWHLFHNSWLFLLV